MSTRRVAFRWALLFGTVAFVIYLWVLYGQLTQAFTQQEQFIPTRIFSDVSRIAPPQLRSRIEERLKALAYSPQIAETTITFRLHSLNYPIYLIPDNHPTADAKNLPVVLHFDTASPSAPLRSIDLGGKEIPDVYLEPELVATLTRSGGEGKHDIRTYVKFDEVPAPVWQAIIAIEDQHFLEHKGFDPRGLARALWVDLRTMSLAQGGSTLTQQLVKNLMARRGKNLFRKVNELFLALLLEAKFEKEQILERYLNEVYLGQVGNFDVHGVVEGAKHFFGKRLDQLNLGEVALMAGLIRGPGFYSPYRYKDRAVERQHLVLKKMVETGQIAEAEASEAMKQPIRLVPPLSTSTKAPYFTDFVKAELIRQLKDKMNEQDVSAAGFRVYTTLDMAMNTAAQHAVADGINDLDKRFRLAPNERLEGALASVDHTTGFIRALVGGRSYGQSTFNRILNMKRQVGSTFKPIVYLTAIEKGEDPNGVPYGPGHPAEDAPWKLVYDKGRQSWAPKNYEKEYQGWINLRKALAHSINTVASKLGYEIGYDSIVKTAHDLGVESDLPRVPSLALGVAELSPVELLKVYATIANHGTQDELTVIRGITQEDGTGYARFIYHPKQVYDPGATDLLTDMLTSVFTEGTARLASNMGFDRPAAGKTGTTSNHRDAWFAGYTPQLTTVVWTGLDQALPAPVDPVKVEIKPDEAVPTGKVALTGATSALPIWVYYMKKALAGEPPAQFPVSPYLVDVSIDTHTGKKAESFCPGSQVVTEKYLKSHEPSGSSCETLWPPTVPETVMR